jgi:hypothetical protein
MKKMFAVPRSRPISLALHWFGVFLLPALVSLGNAQTGVRIVPHSDAALNAAKIAVRRYCDMDAAGFRLSRESAARMRTVTVAKEIPDWQALLVISDYQVESARSNPHGILVKVSYHVFGRFDNGDGYTPEPHAETIEVQTVADGDEWKLGENNEDLARPRVGRAQVLKWLTEQAAASTDPEHKRILQAAIQALQ